LSDLLLVIKIPITNRISRLWAGESCSPEGCDSNDFGAALPLVLAMVAYLHALFVPRHNLALEAAALRQQLAVFKRKRLRPKLNRLDRLFWRWRSDAGGPAGPI
jgi:hypothetical protein